MKLTYSHKVPRDCGFNNFNQFSENRIFQSEKIK